MSSRVKLKYVFIPDCHFRNSPGPTCTSTLSRHLCHTKFKSHQNQVTLQLTEPDSHRVSHSHFQFQLQTAYNRYRNNACRFKYPNTAQSKRQNDGVNQVPPTVDSKHKYCRLSTPLRKNFYFCLLLKFIYVF